jgi:hypothetical protein
MADRTDPANPRGDLWHFEERPALREFLKPAPFINMEESTIDLPLAIEMNGHFGVTFDARDRFNGDLLHVEILL